MVVGVCRLSLYFPECGSLKEKRHGLKKIIDRLRSRFNAAVAEVDGQDSWQRSGIGICVVGNEGPHVQSMVDTICGAVEQLYVAQVLDRQVELVHYNDQETFGDSDPPLFSAQAELPLRRMDGDRETRPRLPSRFSRPRQR